MNKANPTAEERAALAAKMFGGLLASHGMIPLPEGPEHPWRDAQIRAMRALLEPALRDADLTFDEVMAGVQGGWFQAWVNPDDMPEAIMVSEFIASPRRRGLHIFAAGGSLAVIKELVPAIEAFARIVGCDVGAASGRKGWLRVLKPLGYRPDATNFCEKALG